MHTAHTAPMMAPASAALREVQVSTSSPSTTWRLMPPASRVVVDVSAPAADGTAAGDAGSWRIRSGEATLVEVVFIEPEVVADLVDQRGRDAIAQLVFFRARDLDVLAEQRDARGHLHAAGAVGLEQ